MATYDLYKTDIGYLLQVQSDLLDDLDTTVVVPLFPLANAGLPTGRLNRVFVIDEKDYIMATHLLGAVPNQILKNPAGNLSANFDEITNALDMLLHGF